MIEIRGVNKWFGQFHVLKDIDLRVSKGERIVISAQFLIDSESSKTSDFLRMDHEDHAGSGDQP